MQCQVHIHARSKLVLIDQKSKCGTTVDGENIKGNSKELGAKDEYSIVLGRYQHPLKYVSDGYALYLQVG